LDCDTCRLKPQRCPNALARKIPRDLHEDARDVARAHAATPQYVEACRRRKKVEMLFAHLKRILSISRPVWPIYCRLDVKAGLAIDSEFMLRRFRAGVESDNGVFLAPDASSRRHAAARGPGGVTARTALRPVVVIVSRKKKADVPHRG
jgi:hypothetical protein